MALTPVELSRVETGREGCSLVGAGEGHLLLGHLLIAHHAVAWRPSRPSKRLVAWCPEHILKALMLGAATQIRLLGTMVERWILRNEVREGTGDSGHLPGLDQGWEPRVWILKAILVPVGAGKTRGEYL